MVLAALAACAGPEPSGTGAGSTAAPAVTTASGLSCPRDLFESETIDRAAGAAGASSPLDAAAAWLGVEQDDPRFDVHALDADRARVRWSPSDDRTTGVLTVVDHGNGWLVETVESCA
ncbi:MAG: hypothetical protein S0880_22285 [Actinomycetota bacterium]|nr:hypothetical protein [Actinomycetota bacterium]